MAEPTNQASVTVGRMRATEGERTEVAGHWGGRHDPEARRLTAPESSGGGGEAPLDSTGS